MIARSLMIGVAGAALMSTGAMAADLYVPQTPVPIYEDHGFSFEGAYVGVTGGGAFTQGAAYGTLGVVAGVNFAVSDPIVAGLEFEADAVFNTQFGTIGNVAARGHLGALVTDNVMIYALAGIGSVFTPTAQAYGEIGAGVEFGVADNISIRGEVAYLRAFNGNDAGRATAGILFHF